MTSNDWILSRVAQEHRRDLLRQAEQERLARQVGLKPGQRGRLFDRALDSLGRRLMTLGGHLQMRRNAVMTTAALHAASARRARSHTSIQRG